MSEPPRQKPRPARPAFPTPGDTPHGTVTPPALSPTPDVPTVPPPAGGTEPELSEARVSGRGGSWRVSVLGRSGRASARSAPLLLLGFSLEDAGGGASAPTLEASVAGRALEDLSDDLLQSALVRAVARPPDTRRRPFFEDADHGGRS